MTQSTANVGERDSRIDVARGLGVLLVLYAHSLEPLFIREDSIFVTSAFVQWRFFYSFHMPLFYFLSGAVRPSSSQGGAPGSVWRRPLREALSLLLFVELCQILGGGLYVLDTLRQGNGDILGALKVVLRGAVLLCDLRLGILWYLVSLPIVVLLATAWTSRIWYARMVVVLMCVVSFVAALRTGGQWDVSNNWFQVRSWLPGLVFFSLGRAWGGRQYPSVWAGLLAFVAVALIGPLNGGCTFDYFGSCPDIRSGFAPWMILGRHGFLPLFYLCAVLGCAGVLGVARALPLPALALVGRRTLPIYVVNAVFLDFVLMKLSRRVVPEQPGLAWYLIILIGTFAIHALGTWVLARPIEALRERSGRWANAFLSRLEKRVSGAAAREVA
jgi:fucose 4-O-acetylase-like acetyltransferase